MKRFIFPILAGMAAFGVFLALPQVAEAQGCTPRQPGDISDVKCGGVWTFENGINLGDSDSETHIFKGTTIHYKDNGTSFRLKGPNDSGTDVQSYGGIFYNDAYDGIGTRDTRAIIGCNIGMDCVFIGPHQVQLIAVDGTQNDGQLYFASRTDAVWNLRADAEVDSPRQLIFDRETTGSTGASNTSDVEVSVDDGDLKLKAGADDQVRVDRQLETSGTAPMLSSCGTSPSITGADSSGIITIGSTSTTSCTVTFDTTFGNTPACVITGDNTSVTYAITSRSATAFTFQSSATMEGDTVSYVCIGQDAD